MLASCIFASIAQFAPLPFPESRPILGICGALYFVLSGVLQLVTTYIDKDAIFLTMPLEASGEEGSGMKSTSSSSSHKNDLLTQFGVRVRTNFPRFSEFYTVILEIVVLDEQTKREVPPDKLPTASQTYSVGNFFDKEGYFYEIGIMEEVKTLFGRLEKGQYDKKPETTKATTTTTGKSKTE